MAANRTFRYLGEDGTAPAGSVWRGSSNPKAIIQLAHGAGEHAMRYVEPLKPLLQAGYLIYAADHRGHGMTSGMSHLGQFGPGGVEAAINDMAVLSRLARAENPGLPLILFGHSMGAMFAQAFLYDHSRLIDAMILSGTLGPGPRLAGSFNDGLPNPRTDYDWLSRDTSEVDKYVADPFAAFNSIPRRRRRSGNCARAASGCRRQRWWDAICRSTSSSAMPIPSIIISRASRRWSMPMVRAA